MTNYAVQFTATETAELLPVERDARPLGAREVAGRTVATLISAGTELNGGYLATSGFPRGSGYAAVFEVEEVGREVEGIKVGDLAFCMGPHRSFQRAEGRINVDHLYTTAPPRDAQRVYQDLLRNRWQRLGAVFDWRDCP